MHRLYWKIFLAFWLSLVFFLAVTLFAASYYLQQTRSRAVDENPHVRQMALISEAREVAESGGITELERWLARLDRSEVNPYYLLDEEDRDLLGRSVPPDLAFRLMRERRHMGQMNDMHMRPPMTIDVADGRSFRLVPDFQGANLWRVLARPRVFALPLLVTALLSGVLCYWLARYLRHSGRSAAPSGWCGLRLHLGGRRSGTGRSLRFSAQADSLPGDSSFVFSLKGSSAMFSTFVISFLRKLGTGMSLRSAFS